MATLQQPEEAIAESPSAAEERGVAQATLAEQGAGAEEPRHSITPLLGAQSTDAASTSRTATLRLMSDLREIIQDPPDGISAALVDESNLYIWRASITGNATIQLGMYKIIKPQISYSQVLRTHRGRGEYIQ